MADTNKNKCGDGLSFVLLYIMRVYIYSGNICNTFTELSLVFFFHKYLSFQYISKYFESFVNCEIQIGFGGVGRHCYLCIVILSSPKKTCCVTQTLSG